MYEYDDKAFSDAVNKHVEKLTFNTREEYLDWVNRWKEEYRYLCLLRKIEKLQRFTLQEKIVNANKQVAILRSQFDHMKADEIIQRITKRISDEYGIKRTWGTWSIYSLILYLLVSRKASKIRASKKREERLIMEATKQS